MDRDPVIAVDFDGTLCESAWPGIGAPNELLIKTLKDFKRWGAKIILWTNRTGAYEEDAVKWCEEQGLIFDAVNENLPEVYAKFGYMRKIMADVYIDDKSVDINYAKTKDWAEKYKWLPEKMIQDKIREVTANYI